MMIKQISFGVAGQPVAKGRPRAFKRGNHIGLYTPDKTANYENLVRIEAAKAMQGYPPLSECCSLSVRLYMQMPKSMTKKDRKLALSGELRPSKKPDVTNILKGIEDAMNGVVYNDDSQIVDLNVQKFYGEIPGAIITIQKI